MCNHRPRAPFARLYDYATGAVWLCNERTFEMGKSFTGRTFDRHGGSCGPAAPRIRRPNRPRHSRRCIVMQHPPYVYATPGSPCPARARVVRCTCNHAHGPSLCHPGHPETLCQLPTAAVIAWLTAGHEVVIRPAQRDRYRMVSGRGSAPAPDARRRDVGQVPDVRLVLRLAIGGLRHRASPTDGPGGTPTAPARRFPLLRPGTILALPSLAGLVGGLWLAPGKLGVGGVVRLWARIGRGLGLGRGLGRRADWLVTGGHGAHVPTVLVAYATT
jgi:hypothetical protein